MRGIVLSFALLLAGCGGHSNVQVSSSGASSGGSVNIQGRSTVGALIAIGILAGATYGGDRRYDGYRMSYRAHPFIPTQSNVPAPELDAARTVNEQDCSKPIENRSANLKCR